MSLQASSDGWLFGRRTQIALALQYLLDRLQFLPDPLAHGCFRIVIVGEYFPDAGLRYVEDGGQFYFFIRKLSHLLVQITDRVRLLFVLNTPVLFL